jgi:precorrin-6B methylase 2
MATTILSGRSLILTIATKDYSDQILSANLTIDTERLTFDTIAGRAYKYLDKNATLDLTFLNDIGEADSITKALWDATESAPDTVLVAVLTATTGKTFTFNVLPNFPSQGGSGSDAQQVTTSLQVSGNITEVLT